MNFKESYAIRKLDNFDPTSQTVAKRTRKSWISVKRNTQYRNSGGITGSIPAAAAAAARAGFLMELRAVGAAAAAATAAAHTGLRTVSGVPGFNPADDAAARIGFKIGFKIGFSAAEPNNANGFHNSGRCPGSAARLLYSNLVEINSIHCNRFCLFSLNHVSASAV